MKTPLQQQKMSKFEVTPAMIESLVKSMRDAEKAKDDFFNGPVFKAMREKLLSNKEAVSIDSENAAYFPEKAKAAVGWEDFTKDDLRSFWNVVGSPDSKYVDPGSVKNTSDIFESYNYRVQGIHVWMMIGQGTALSVGNREQ